MLQLFSKRLGRPFSTRVNAHAKETLDVGAQWSNLWTVCSAEFSVVTDCMDKSDTSWEFLVRVRFVSAWVDGLGCLVDCTYLLEPVRD